MALTIIGRREALVQGLARYYTGKCCKRGHAVERYVCNCECVQCVYEKTKAREWHKQNPERHRAHGRKWDQANSERKLQYRVENREKLSAYFKARWHSIPLEERKAKKSEWYKANREHAIAYTAQWVQTNPEQAQASKVVVSHRRRERRRAAGGSFTAADVRALLQAQNHRCAYCAADLREVKKHLDHILPLALGGTNDRTNLQWLCQPCNLSKAAKHPVSYAQERSPGSSASPPAGGYHLRGAGRCGAPLFQQHNGERR